MDVLLRLLALLCLLLVGTGLRRIGVLDARRTTRLNAAVYYGALPALVFVGTYDQPIGQLLSPGLVAGLFAVLLATAGLAWVVHRNRSADARRSVATVQSYHSNLGYLGLPFVAATFDAEVTAIAAVILGILSLLQVPLTVLILTTVNSAETRLTRELARLGTNPVLLALVAGVAVGSSGHTPHQTVVVGLEVLAAVALPLALLCVGASLQVDLPSIDLGATASVIALKVCLMPVLAWTAFSVLAVDAATFTAGVVMLGTPTAVSTYVFASELGGDERFASLNVFATTVASIATLFVLVAILG